MSNTSEPTPQQLFELTALYQQRNYQSVLRIAEERVQQFPQSPIIAYLHAAAHVALGHPEQAIAEFARALQLKPDFAEAHNDLGDVLRNIGHFKAAIDHYRQAIRIKPQLVRAHIGLGGAYFESGMPAEASQCFENALTVDPDNPAALYSLSEVTRFRQGDPRIQKLQQLIKQSSLSNTDRIQLNFALAKAYRDIGEFEQSFDCYARGNELRRKEITFDLGPVAASFARIKSAFSIDRSDLDAATLSTGNNECRPVFVVGMPRSGTTLVEQILASHSRVHAAGELVSLGQAINSAGWPANPLSAQLLQFVRNAYLLALARIETDAPWITDKMPANFYWIGFIATALPEASIIHVTRDARAVCWSIFKQYFSDQDSGYAWDLGEIAEYYKLYADLMAFWHATFPARIYDLNYEALTEQQQPETRKLLDHIGLPWEEQCLAYFDTRREVLTASAAQVRQEMYRGSSDEWRNYARNLEALVESLTGY
ncbi:MAG: sulfotransferase [Woeseiaceae bacterium]|nr:sulfotransferase [Woeseiaceae bacterium]